MATLFQDLSSNIASAVERAAGSVVQVYGHRRPSAGIVFAADLIATPAAALAEDTAVVRRPDGSTVEGQVLGHAFGTGLGLVRVSALGLPPAAPAPEPRVGAIAVAVGRTWSGSVMASVTNIAVIGGPLRTGRSTQIERVIRIAQPPHGALSGGALVDAEGGVLGVITASAIRGTTVVIPVTLAWNAAHHIVAHGGTRQGYLGISTMPAALARRQRGDAQESGLLITAVAPDSPAESASLLVGDVILQFAGEAVREAETLATLLRGDHIGKPVTLSVLRGVQRHDVAVVVGERPTRRD
jgi:S1-C subfamily serine protease